MGFERNASHYFGDDFDKILFYLDRYIAEGGVCLREILIDNDLAKFFEVAGLEFCTFFTC